MDVDAVVECMAGCVREVEIDGKVYDALPFDKPMAGMHKICAGKDVARVLWAYLGLEVDFEKIMPGLLPGEPVKFSSKGGERKVIVTKVVTVTFRRWTSCLHLFLVEVE